MTLTKPKPKRLTDESVKALKLGDGQREREVRDPECPGLIVRVGKASRTYWFYWRTGAKLVKQQLGRAGDASGALKLSKARDIARGMRERANAGTDPRGSDTEEAPETFEALASLYVRKYAMGNRRSWQEDEMLLRVHVTPSIGKRRLVTLDGPTFARLHQDIREAGAAKDAETAKRLNRKPRPHAGGRIADRVLGLVKSIMRWGTPLGYVMGDLTVGIRKAGAKGGRKRALEDIEIAALIRALPEIYYENESMQIAVRLTLMFGTRKMEVVAMRRDELHLDVLHPHWQLPGGDVRDGGGKTDEHRLPLIPEAVRLLKRAMELHDGTT